MKDCITCSDLTDIFAAIYQIMQEHKEELTALDAAIGDGDLGITMCDGFSRVYEAVRDANAATTGKALSTAGMVMNKHVPSTMGTLLSVALIKMGAHAKEWQVLEAASLPEVFETGLNGMMAIGKSKVGDKTVLDALFPACEAMKKTVNTGGSLLQMLDDAVAAAEIGVEQTKAMISKHGRGSWYQEQSLGKQDPGATAGMLIVTGMRDWCRKADLDG